MNRYLLTAFVAVISACNPGSGPHRPISTDGGPTVATKGGVSYETVKPVFAKYCSECHPARSSPDWLNYSEAINFVRNGLLMQRAVTDKSMPPAGSVQAAAISDQERSLIGKWAQAGGPETSSSSGGGAPPPSKTPSGNPLVQSCLQCHGVRGPGSQSQPKIPRLGGQNQPYLVYQLKSFRGRRRIDASQTMNDKTYGLTDAQIDMLASYFAGITPVDNMGRPTEKVEKAMYDKGEALAYNQLCVSCHLNPQNNDLPLDPLEPIIDGQSKQYLFIQITEFRRDATRNKAMHEYTKDLSDEDVEALAEFFSRGKTPVHE